MMKCPFPIILLKLCLTSPLIASSPLHEDDDADTPLNWTATYWLKNRTKVIHTPEHIQIGSDTVATSLNYTGRFQGMNLSAVGLKLQKNYTRRQFEDALKASGIYGGAGNPPKQSQKFKTSLRNSDPGQVGIATESSTATDMPGSPTISLPISNPVPAPLGQKD